MSLPTINSPLKTGFIFIPLSNENDRIYTGYGAYRFGGIGYFALLNPALENGHEMVPVSHYLAA